MGRWWFGAMLALGACDPVESPLVSDGANERDSPDCGAAQEIGDCWVEACCSDGQCFYLADDGERFDCDGTECGDTAYDVVAYCR